MPLLLALIDVELLLSGGATRSKSLAQKNRPCASLLVCLRPPLSVVLDDDDDDGISLVSSGES